MGPALTRRALAASAAAIAVAGPGSTVSAAARIPFGAAANHFVLAKDAAYRDALLRHCDLFVAEGAMKWDVVRAQPGRFDFSLGDQLVEFARRNGKQVRGHTLVWCEANPPWLQSLSTAAEAERELRRHIERVVPHYKDTISSWDVVNEAVAEKPRNSMDLRQGIWPALLGERYIDLAFRVAHEMAPHQQRVLNDYGIEHASTRDRLKRAGLKRLVHDLRSRDVPVTAIGLQAHLDGAAEIDTDGISAFCHDMSRNGLEILITELDVNDVALPGDIDERDRIVAQKASQFLSAVFAGCRPTAVCTWGLTDRYTWMPMWFKRADGLNNRPLPLDADLRPKPMLRALTQQLGR